MNERRQGPRTASTSEDLFEERTDAFRRSAATSAASSNVIWGGSTDSGASMFTQRPSLRAGKTKNRRGPAWLHRTSGRTRARASCS